MFQRQNTKLDNSFKIKVNGKRLFPTTTKKYLGVLLDRKSTWCPQISHVPMKLNRAIGILNKLRYQANIYIHKTVYHSLFGTHLLYSCQLRGQNKKETQNQCQTLETRVFKKLHLKTDTKVQILPQECLGVLLVFLHRFTISIDYSICLYSQQKKKYNI